MRKVDTVGWIRSRVGWGGYDEDYQETALADHSTILCLEGQHSIIFYFQSGNEFAKIMIDFSQPVSCLDTDPEKTKCQCPMDNYWFMSFYLIELIIECIQYLNGHGGSGHGETLVSRLY